jgi:hypothetical protein
MMRGFDLIGKLMCWVAVAVLLPAFSHAQNYPTTGIIYNTSEWSSLHYECELQTDGTLNCNMTQASVRRESGSKKLQEEIAKSGKSIET